MNAFDAGLWQVERLTAFLACVALFVIMVLVFGDAAMRYMFNSPLKFTVDVVVYYLLSASILLVLSYTMRGGGHVSVELFTDMMPRRVFHALVGAGLLCSTVVIGIMAWRISGLTWEAWERNELQVGIYSFPMWPSKGIVALGLILLELRIVHSGLGYLAAGISGDQSYAPDLRPLSEHPEEEGA